MKYELVCGLETHVELSTKTKIFCGCTTEFGGDQNTHCCPGCLALPGALPVLNKKVVEYGIKAGLATDCAISRVSKMDRKNYCYPDLPSAYQISQFDKPLCIGGHIELSNGRKIRIHHMHIEEDAGKLVHKKGNTYVDLNRGGVPLVEIVTEPDFRAIEEVREYLEKLQSIMRYIGVSDCRMQEGSIRCDVNISLRPVGTEEFGTRTEIKNMNSFTFIERAMRSEINRQADLLDSGEQVEQQTLRYIVEEDRTEPMRSKEDANDYRYFRDPDLVTIHVDQETVDRLAAELPELPHQKMARYMSEMELPESDAAMLTKYRNIAEYFEAAAEGVQNKKTIANCIIGQVFRRVETEVEKEAFNISIPPKYLTDLVLLLESGKIKNNLMKATLEKMLDEGKPYTDFISESDMGGIDEDTLKKLCAESIANSPNAVADYLGGKEKALKSLLGYVMKNSRGKADAVEAEKLLAEMIKENA